MICNHHNKINLFIFMSLIFGCGLLKFIRWTKILKVKYQFKLG